MTTSTYQVRFDKASAAYAVAHGEVQRSYAIWCDACERLKHTTDDQYVDLLARIVEALAFASGKIKPADGQSGDK